MGRLHLDRQAVLTRRAIVARLLAVALLTGTIALLAELHREAMPRWRSPALAATRRGLLLAWVEGPAESSAVRIRWIGSDLRPRGAARRLAAVPPATQLALSPRAPRTLVLGRPYRDAILLATVDENARTIARRDGDSGPSGQDSWPVMTATDLETEGLAARSGRRRVPLGQAEYDGFPNSGACAWGRPWQAAPVIGPRGEVVACVEPAKAGRAWRIRARGSPRRPRHRRELARLEGAHCPSSAEYGCVAAVDRGSSLSVAWVRRGPFTRSFVLSRVGGAERVLDREVAVTGVCLGGVGAAIVLLLLGAIRELGSLARLLRAFVPKRPAVVLTGQLRDCRFDPRGGWQMSVGAGSLTLEDGSSVQILPGEPLVVTLAALRGELPRRDRAVGLFDRVHVMGIDDDRAVRIELISDAPVVETLRAVRARLAVVAVDAAALLAIGWALFAVLGR